MRLSLVLNFSATQLTIISFVIMSFIGAGILSYTERNNTFIYNTPRIEQVELNYTKSQTTILEDHVTIEQTEEKGLKFVDAWFTAVSALCVTGLTTIDFSEFTIVGQIITMILIQMGGLGIILFTSVFAMAVFRGLSERLSVKSLLSQIMDTKFNDVIDMMKYVVFFTFVFEGLAFLIMGTYLEFFKDPALINNINPWWWSLFHSVSAFNNAGFGLLNNNLSSFVTDPVINITIASLIVLGGLGYPVLIASLAFVRSNIFRFKGATKKALEHDLAGVASVVQIRVALIGTFLLIVLGSLIPFLIEVRNPILTEYNIFQKIIITTFQSVSTRTAGFNTVDIGALHIETILLYIILMFIGANPAGTGGGIKIPTVAALYGYIKDWFAKPGEPVKLIGRRVSKFAVSHSIRLFFFSIIFTIIIVFIISILESKYLITPDSTFNFQKILFEVYSAFGTVGLSMGYTGGVTSFAAILTPFSKVLLIATMLFGRIGPLTMLQSIPWKHPEAHEALSPDYNNSDRMQIG